MFRKSLGIRHLVCGSCNGCEHEMNALNNPLHDITQLGWDVVASPRHADVLTVTGPMTDAMRRAASAAVEATPAPRVIVAVGDCALGIGPWAGADHSGTGAVRELGARVEVAGCPPSPSDIIRALRRAGELLDEERAQDI